MLRLKSNTAARPSRCSKRLSSLSPAADREIAQAIAITAPSKLSAALGTAKASACSHSTGSHGQR